MKSVKIPKRLCLAGLSAVLVCTTVFSVYGAEDASKTSSTSSDTASWEATSSLAPTTYPSGMTEKDVERIMAEIRQASESGNVEDKLNELIQKSILTGNTALKSYAEYAKQVVSLQNQVVSLQNQLNEVNANIKALVATNPELEPINAQFQASVSANATPSAAFEDLETFLSGSTAEIFSGLDDSALESLSETAEKLSSANSVANSDSTIQLTDSATALQTGALGDVSEMRKNEVLGELANAQNLSASDVANIINGLDVRDGLSNEEILGALNSVEGLSDSDIVGIVSALEGVSEEDKLAILESIDPALADQYEKEQALMEVGLLQEALDQGLLEGEDAEKAKECIDAAMATLSALERSKYTDEEHAALQASSEEFGVTGNKTRAVLPEQVVMPNDQFKLTKPAIMYDDQLLISVEDIVQFTGAAVEYTDVSGTVALQTANSLVEVTKGKNMGYVNDKATSMPVPVLSFKGLTYISVEFFAQAYSVSSVKLAEQSVFVMYDNLNQVA